MGQTVTKEEVSKALRTFTARRDEVLHEDVAAFDHNLGRLIELCQTNQLIQKVLSPLIEQDTANIEKWWEAANRDGGKLTFPDDAGQELALRYRVLEFVAGQPRQIWQFGFAHGIRKRDDSVQLFRTMIVRPFLDELSHRLGEAADMASPEDRALQAVPLNRIPSPTEIRIFLSHKSVDKPMVKRYFNALKQAGFTPWLDEANMTAGANLERGLLQGFEESCAAVFFITENFKDEQYLATEVDYAVMQKRRKGRKFAIITLRYSNAAPVPGLLTPYVYKDVSNDLEGFHELLRALPIELGPVRWTLEAVS